MSSKTGRPAAVEAASGVRGPSAALRPLAPRTLAAQLTLWYTASAFTLVLCASLYIYWALAGNLAQEDEDTLAAQAQRTEAALQASAGSAMLLQREIDAESGARRFAPIYVRVLDQAGRVIAESRGTLQALDVTAFPEPGAPGAPSAERSGTGGETFRVVAVRAASVAGRAPDHVVQVALDESAEENLLADFRRRAAPLLLVILGACALAGHFIARRGTRPLREMSETMSRIGSARFEERIGVAGLPAELAGLAGSFNDMVDRLQDSFNRLGRFSADIAHELRTPLNNLRGEIEVGFQRARTPDEYRDLLGSCLEECQRLQRIIDGLLFLARAENPLMRIARERTDIGAELGTLREFYDPAAADAGIRLDVPAAGGLWAQVDRTLLQRAVGNLIENALAYTPAGGAVRVVAGQSEGAVRIDVTDTGCGISAQHLAHVFDRFYRVDQNRAAGSGGFGLGLAIVKSIVELHGGRAEVESAPGSGTRVALRFPIDA